MYNPRKRRLHGGCIALHSLYPFMRQQSALLNHIQPYPRVPQHPAALPNLPRKRTVRIHFTSRMITRQQSHNRLQQPGRHFLCSLARRHPARQRHYFSCVSDETPVQTFRFHVHSVLRLFWPLLFFFLRAVLFFFILSQSYKIIQSHSILYYSLLLFMTFYYFL